MLTLILMIMSNGSIRRVVYVKLHLGSSPRVVVNALRGSDSVDYGSILIFIPDLIPDFYGYLCYIYSLLRIKRYFTVSVDFYLDPSHYDLAKDHYELSFLGFYYFFEKVHDKA